MFIVRLILIISILVNCYHIVLAIKDEDANPKAKKNYVAFTVSVILLALSFVVK